MRLEHSLYRLGLISCPEKKVAETAHFLFHLASFVLISSFSLLQRLNLLIPDTIKHKGDKIRDLFLETVSF
ncbi:MAG: hypothetical protein NTU85_00510 [Candidatus Kaiserbacteria bacterium]|nr:hypothetical protein [Candidatus Kaiserbacteria bacterium]